MFIVHSGESANHHIIAKPQEGLFCFLLISHKRTADSLENTDERTLVNNCVSQLNLHSCFGGILYGFQLVHFSLLYTRKVFFLLVLEASLTLVPCVHVKVSSRRCTSVSSRSFFLQKLACQASCLIFIGPPLMYVTSGLEYFVKRLPLIARFHSRGSVKCL